MNFKRSMIASRAILVPLSRAGMRDSRRRPMISTRECTRPEGFRSTMEIINGPAVTEDAVARKRMREAMKTTSGDGDFYNDMSWQVEENNLVDQPLRGKQHILRH